MKRHLAMLIAGLSFVAAPLFAVEPATPPSPDDPEETVNAVFIGRYGESFELPHGWTADAESNGLTEIVYIHRKSFDDSGLKPFHPKPSDYKLDRFATLGLLELVVAPGGLRGLSDLRAAKEKELNETGAAFNSSRLG